MIIVSLLIGYFTLNHFHMIPFKKYSNAAFKITVIKSEKDKDHDGLDDYTDLVTSAYEYITTKPKYESRYYATGYPNDGYGVCTDVIGYAMKHSGYDLQSLVDQDIKANKKAYRIDKPDRKIDFRRVKNLKVYFDHTAISLTTDPYDIEAWMPGDIVVWKKHVGMISNYRNHKGIAYVLHHANPHQKSYEQDVLTRYGKIVGHYRLK